MKFHHTCNLTGNRELAAACERFYVNNFGMGVAFADVTETADYSFYADKVRREGTNMGESLKGRVAIVTGAGSVPGPPDLDLVGNGKACAMAYAREGASVLAADLSAETAEDTKRRIDAEGGICSVFEADVSNAQE